MTNIESYVKKLLTSTEHEIDTGRITPVVPVDIIARQEARDTGQIVIECEWPESHVLTEFDVKTTANHHRKIRPRSRETGRDRNRGIEAAAGDR